jgi:outer membrane protein assembly factor BamA
LVRACFNGATNVGAAGGTTYFNGTLEVSAPMPAVSREMGLRFNVFADAATLYGNDIAALTSAPRPWSVPRHGVASINRRWHYLGLSFRSVAGLLC